MGYTILSLARKLGRDTMSRLIKPTEDNVIGGGLFGLLGTLAEAHLHKWSFRAIVGNLWETVLLPWLLVFCILFAWHLWQAVRNVYRQERTPFANALGGTTNIPPWRFRWRCYLVFTIYLSIPTACAYLALERSGILGEMGQVSEPITPPSLPDPIVHIEPDVGQVPALNGQDGLFAITIDNGGVDVDHFELAKDYFMVLRDQGRLKVARLVEAIRGPIMPSDFVPLRANQPTVIQVNFNFGGRSMAERLEKSGYQGLVGVRLRAYYRRYADQKDFSTTKVFFVEGTYKFLVAPEQSGIAQVAPFVLSGYELKELLSHIDSDQDWVDPIFQQSVPDGKMTVIFGPTH